MKRRPPRELGGGERLRQPVIEEGDRRRRERQSLASPADDLEPTALKLAVVAYLKRPKPTLRRNVEHHIPASSQIGRVARLDIPRETATPESSPVRSTRTDSFAPLGNATIAYQTIKLSARATPGTERTRCT